MVWNNFLSKANWPRWDLESDFISIVSTSHRLTSKHTTGWKRPHTAVNRKILLSKVSDEKFWNHFPMTLVHNQKEGYKLIQEVHCHLFFFQLTCNPIWGHCHVLRQRISLYWQERTFINFSEQQLLISNNTYSPVKHFLIKGLKGNKKQCAQILADSALPLPF